jgi:hypothetical protein
MECAGDAIDDESQFELGLEASRGSTGMAGSPSWSTCPAELEDPFYANGSSTCSLPPAKVTDIESTRMMLRVEQGEGRRDRYVMLSPQLLAFLRAWWRRATGRA